MTTIIGSTTNYHNPLSQLDSGSLLPLNERFANLDAAIASFASVAAGTLTVVAGQGIAANDAVYISRDDGKAYLLDNDALSPSVGFIRGFATETASAEANVDIQIGDLLGGFSSLTALQPVYAGSVAGEITQVRPVPAKSGGQVAIIQLGIAWSATQILIRPMPVQYHLRDAMAQNDELSIVHHYDDASAPLRQVWAYITETAAGATAQSYASGNQDEDVVLLSSTPASYTVDQCTGGTPIGDMIDGDGLAGAFDNDLATEARKSGSTTGIIGYDFGIGNEKTIRRYTIGEDTGAVEDAAPRDWTFQYSTNGTDWTTVDTRTSETFTDGEVKPYDISSIVSARYWRLNISANNGSTPTIVGELEMMEAVDYENEKLTQTFTLASETDIASVGLWLKKVGGPTGTATVRIETVSAGEPTGILADAEASITFAESTLDTSYAEELLVFASEFTLSAGTYAIVLSTNRVVSTSDYIAWGADGSSPSYAGGEMLSEESSSWSSESKDAVFSVYQPGVVNVGRISVDWWSSSHADIVNRYGDGAGSDGDTKTTFKCTRVAGFDDVTLVVEVA